ADLALDPVPDRGDGALQSIEPCLQVVPNVPNDRRENRLHVLVPDRADLRLDRVPDRVDRGLQEIESRLKLTLMKLTIGLNTYVLMNVQSVLIVFLIAFQTGLITESRNHVNAFDSVPRMNDTTALKTIFTAAHQILMMPVI